MKYLAVLAIALFLNGSNGLKLKFSDFPIEENAEMMTETKKMEGETVTLMTEIDTKVAQAERNANQGELGRTLAMNKINEIKLHLSQLSKNFQKQAEIAVTDGVVQDAPMYNLVQKKSNVSGLKGKAEAILEKIPKVQELEWTLGLPEDVKDEELVSVTKVL